jgi:hypothetical protein
MHGEVVLVVIGLKPVCVPSNTLCGVILTVVVPVVVRAEASIWSVDISSLHQNSAQYLHHNVSL